MSRVSDAFMSSDSTLEWNNTHDDIFCKGYNARLKGEPDEVANKVREEYECCCEEHEVNAITTFKESWYAGWIAADEIIQQMEDEYESEDSND